jgi:hypothetical protein
MTLLDEAEMAGVIVPLVEGVVALKVNPTALPEVIAEAAADWKRPLPAKFAWADNYVSAYGLAQPGAVDICLPKKVLELGFGALVSGHEYSHEWYEKTVVAPTPAKPDVSIFGFRRSHEYELLSGTTRFPPSDSDFGFITSFHQSAPFDNELLLAPLPALSSYECFVPLLTVPYAAPLEFGIRVTGQAAKEVVAGISAVGRKLGEVEVALVERAGVALANAASATVEAVSDATQHVIDLANRVEIRLRLLTGLPIAPSVGQPALQAAGAPAANTPAYVWLPVSVPADAKLMAFDFAVEGDAKADAIVFGVNGTNLFTLPLRFVETNKTISSSLFDATPYAGKTNEFFLGVAGGTSTNCAVTVEHVRFYTLASPKLEVTLREGVPTLLWPSSPSGYALEMTSDLGKAEWVSVTNTPSLFGGRYTQEVSINGSAQFFRLRAR